LVASGLLIVWMTDRLEPHLVPDSASYMNYPFDSLDAACRSIRTPGYPLWLRMISGVWDISLVPICQVIAHATAVFVLMIELKRWSMPSSQLVAVAVAVGIGCTPSNHISTISTDALACSLGIITAALLLRWTRSERTFFAAVLCVMAAITTIMVRPAYLFLIPWLFVAGWMVQRMRGASPRNAAMSSLFLATLALVPILGWMSFRLAVVRDFGMLPFGHQNLAGILVQLVSDDELLGIQGDNAKLAHEIVGEKKRLAAAGHRFTEGDPQATMTIDARWDDMTYFVVIPAAQRVVGDEPIAQHRKIAELNQTIIRHWPQRYGVWLLKSARRGAWAIAADIVMHPTFLIAIALAMVYVLYRAVTLTNEPTVTLPQPSLSVLAIIAITYLVMKLGFVILTSPPIGRFGDAAAIFLPAWLASSFIKSCVADVSN
jgi:hypothetical protein